MEGNLASVTSHKERLLLGNLAGDSLAWIGASDGQWLDKSYWDFSTFFDSSEEIILDSALSGDSIVMKGPGNGWSKSEWLNNYPFLCQTSSEYCTVSLVTYKHDISSTVSPCQHLGPVPGG